MNIAQLKKTEQQLTFVLKLLSATVTLLMIGSCVSQPTVKPNQGQKTPVQTTAPAVVPTVQPSQNSHTIITTTPNRPAQPTYGQVGNNQIVLPRPTTPPSINTIPAVVPSQTLPTQPATTSPTHQYGSFYEWQQDFLRRNGSAALVVNNAHLNNSVIRLDKNQAEFNTAPWAYVDARTKSSTVLQGQKKRREHLSIFDRNEQQYGVPASIVTAIWGIETGFGGNMGSMSVTDALASLAFDGRRRTMAEEQLVALAEIVNRGDVAPTVKGSHAGAMGHTQFMPKTWLQHGVDGDGDGRKNPMSTADAVTSTANYLANSGWVRDLPVYFEVNFPPNFDYRYLASKMTLDQWRAMGLTTNYDQLSGNYPAELWLPAGINGPALLLTQNFDVIKVYNNSSNYALAVAVLAQKLNGRVGLQKDFPRYEQMLTKAQAEHLQKALIAQGYNVGVPDGIIGTNTRKAFAQWQAKNGKIPDGFISLSTAGQLLY